MPWLKDDPDAYRIAYLQHRLNVEQMAVEEKKEVVNEMRRIQFHRRRSDAT